MKFKVGDKVRVREDLNLSACYGTWATNRLVDKDLIGEVVTISDGEAGVYFIEEDNLGCNWTEEMLEPVDPLADKIEERNNKEPYTPMTIEEHNEAHLGEPHDPIKPAHYRKGEIDLYESWYRTYPFNEFRAGMQMIAERYMRRDKDNRPQDLDKARYTLQRLKEYEEMEKEKNERYIATYGAGTNIGD